LRWGCSFCPAPTLDTKAQVQQLDLRTAPIATVITDASQLPKPKAAAAQQTMSGKEVVARVCSACHETGALGAPRIGDSAAWSARFKQAGGVDGLLQVALHGKGSMPPKGGQPSLSDTELRGAIMTMLERSQVNTK
jgi:cytochrome c5